MNVRVYLFNFFKVLPSYFCLVLSMEYINYKIILFHENQMQDVHIWTAEWVIQILEDFSISTGKLEFESLMSMCDGTGHKHEPRGILGKQMTGKTPPTQSRSKKNYSPLLNVQHIGNKTLHLKHKEKPGEASRWWAGADEKRSRSEVALGLPERAKGAGFTFESSAAPPALAPGAATAPPPVPPAQVIVPLLLRRCRRPIAQLISVVRLCFRSIWCFRISSYQEDEKNPNTPV